ncbi:MAG: AMP-binding protein [Rhodospirillales bacterium]|nr:AMP-binding protein [Rhodospirillales bacterium]
MANAQYFDALETRDREAREAALFAALPAQLAHAKAHATAYVESLAEVEPAAVTGRAALAKLPLLRKSAIHALQQATPPLGGLNAKPVGEAGRIFSSPGPIYELGGRDSGYRRLARALFAAGFRRGMIVHNSFAYHLTPGGWILDAGARALGCTVIPAGIGNSEQQLDAIQQLRPEGFTGTPDFLKILLDKGQASGHDLSSIRHALVSGGALFPSLRQEYTERGVACFQCYATAEVGLIAYETAAPDGSPNPGMVVDEGVILEIVRPGTGDPLPPGEVGEVVITNFSPVYPMVRLATGDLSALVAAPSPCGRTNLRIEGWMGRADQTAKIKGMFVHPEQIAAVLARHPEVLKGRLEVVREGEQDAMILHCEVAAAAEGLEGAVAESLTQVTKLKGKVAVAEVGSLANDGKVIDDRRDYN